VIHTCPNCGGRVKITSTNVKEDGMYIVVEYRGKCTKCGSNYRKTIKQTKKRFTDYRCSVVPQLG